MRDMWDRPPANYRQYDELAVVGIMIIRKQKKPPVTQG